ncbi:trigger factor [Candidatus Peregrinibacteria bacterium]|nr:trigger factor [Candidatus Peregrinibacteria bacterium]
MDIRVEKLPKSEIKLMVELNDSEFLKFRTEIIEELTHEVELPGFRRGKVPAHVIDEKFGDTVRSQVMERALMRSYADAIRSQNIQPILVPHIKIISEKPFKYEATVALQPEISLKDEDISIPSETIEVTQKEIDDYFLEVRRSFATFQDVDRKAQKDDRLEISYDVFDGVVKIDGAGSKHHPFILGEGFFMPDFEKEVTGMKTGEEKRFIVHFPGDYHYAPFRDKDREFVVKVEKVQEVILPEFNEDFIVKVTGAAKDKAEFERETRELILEYKKKNERERRENALFEKFIAISSFEISDMLIEAEIDFEIEQLKKDMERRNVPFERYLEMIKEKKKDIRTEFREKAEKQVKIRLILQYLFRKHDFKVSDDEVEEFRKSHKNSTLASDRIRSQLLLDKLFSYYLK